MKTTKSSGNVFKDLGLANPKKLEKESLEKLVKHLQKQLKEIKGNIQILYEMESEEPRKRGLNDALSVVNEVLQ